MSAAVKEPYDLGGGDASGLDRAHSLLCSDESKFCCNLNNLSRDTPREATTNLVVGVVAKP